jgi:hypothetical protein
VPHLEQHLVVAVIGFEVAIRAAGLASDMAAAGRPAIVLAGYGVDRRRLIEAAGQLRDAAKVNVIVASPAPDRQRSDPAFALADRAINSSELVASYAGGNTGALIRSLTAPAPARRVARVRVRRRVA